MCLTIRSRHELVETGDFDDHCGSGAEPDAGRPAMPRPSSSQAIDEMQMQMARQGKLRASDEPSGAPDLELGQVGGAQLGKPVLTPAGCEEAQLADGLEAQGRVEYAAYAPRAARRQSLQQ